MFFKKRKRIDLSMIGNFREPKRCKPIQRLYDIVITAITDIFVYASNVGVALGLGPMTLGNWFTVAIAAFSIGWTIYAAVASKDKAQTGGVPNSLDSNGQLVNTRQASDPLRVLYGIVKTGGVWVYTKFSAVTNDLMNVIVTWSEGEISGIATGIDSVVAYSGATLNDMETGGEFAYAGGCTCDMMCNVYSTCSCDMTSYSA